MELKTLYLMDGGACVCVCVWGGEGNKQCNHFSINCDEHEIKFHLHDNIIWGQSVILLQLKSGSGWRLHIGSWWMIVQGSGKMRFRCIKRISWTAGKQHKQYIYSFSNQTKMKRALGNIHWVPPPHQTSLCLKSVKVCCNMFDQGVAFPMSTETIWKCLTWKILHVLTRQYCAGVQIKQTSTYVALQNCKTQKTWVR